jgi:hypothetical protein
MSLYYNCCILEQLGYELRPEMNINAFKMVLITLVYLNFVLFVASFQHIKLSKYTKSF